MKIVTDFQFPYESDTSDCDLLNKLSLYSDWQRAGRSEDRIPVVARFSAPVQTGPGFHPSSYKMGTGSLSRG
jgi:hypothetical protein